MVAEGPRDYTFLIALFTFAKVVGSIKLISAVASLVLIVIGASAAQQGCADDFVFRSKVR